MIAKYKSIPERLKLQHQWVVWGIPGEAPKAPFNPTSLLLLRTIPAKSGVPETWSDYDTAVRCVSAGIAKGIGYEFTGQGVYGVDMDNVINEKGVIAPQAQAIIEQLDSYTEYSPSGRGLHIFVTADNVNIMRHRKQGEFIEIYHDGRYFTMTGNVYGGYDQIQHRPNELQQIHDRYLLPEQGVSPPYMACVESSQDNDYYLKRGLQKDRVFRSHWNGECRGGDESASDQALMNKLAYWCNANPAAMITTFLQSPYYAQKGEAHTKKCQRADYLSNTARKACATLRSTAHRDTIQRKKERNDAR